jgi:hypothetical protein
VKRYAPWPAWLVAVIGSFSVLEWVALRRGTFPPLTHFLRWLLGINPRRGFGRLAPAAFLGGCTYLVVHLIHDAMGDS